MASLHFRVGQWPCDHRVGEDGQQFVLQHRGQFLPGVAAGADHHPFGAHHAARGLKVVDTIDRLPALHRAGRVHFHAQFTGLADQPEGELQGVDADAFFFKHRPHVFALVAVLLTHFFGREHARAVTKHFVAHTGHLAQVVEFFRAMRHVQVPPVVSLALDLLGECAEIFKTRADLGVQPLGHIQAPTLDPL